MNTAVFSVVNAVLLRPLPYPDADRLVWLANYNERFKVEMVAGPDFFDWKAQAQSFDKMAAYGMGSFTLGVGSEADQAGVVSVTDDFSALTGARPEVGRLFTAAERNVVLITDRLLRGGSAAIRMSSERPITINGAPNTICGVLPASFRFVLPADFPGIENREIEAYVPIAMTPQNQVRGRQMMAVATIASLKPGVGVGQAFAEIAGHPGEHRAAEPGRLLQPRHVARPPAAGKARRRLPAGARRAIRGGRIRAAHRLREYRESAAGAGHVPAQGNRGARRHRGGTRRG